MLVQPQLGHMELAQGCSRFVLDETFEPRLNLPDLQDMQKECVSA